MQIDNDELKLIFEPRIGIGLAGQVISETAVLATKKISHEISPSQKTCKSVAFSFPRPPHAELAEKLFCCPLLYEQNWTGIVFDLEAMQTQRKKKDPLAIADALEISSNAVAVRLHRALKRLKDVIDGSQDGDKE